MSITDLLPKRLRRVKLNLPGELDLLTAATRAEFVLYADTHPDFEGGGYLEVSDHCGECLLSEPADDLDAARTMLSEIVVEDLL